GLRQKLAQRLPGFGNGEAVQVDFALHAVVAAAELAQDGRLDAATMEDELLTARELGINDDVVQALLQNRQPVGAGEARGRARAPRAAR
ncbi:MAG: hypothetical protein ACRETR_01485, partial [Steroidobacteraceae bacterium]